MKITRAGLRRQRISILLENSAADIDERCCPGRLSAFTSGRKQWRWRS
jgi:hypothetical protein